VSSHGIEHACSIKRPIRFPPTYSRRRMLLSPSLRESRLAHVIHQGKTRALSNSSLFLSLFGKVRLNPLFALQL